MEKEIIFKLGVDASSGEKSIQEMEKELDNAKKSSDKFISNLDELKKKVDSGGLSMREMTKVVKEYQSIAMNAGRETPVGQYAIQQAAELTDMMGDLRAEINRTAHDGKNLQGAMELAGGIVAGYGALQGVMALAGNENEQLTQTLVKLSAIQSILAGIEQIRLALEKESSTMILLRTTRTKALVAWETIYATAVGTTTGAMKALRIAMLALPIIAIIAGIAALIGWIASLVSEEEKAEKQNDALTASYERQTAALNRASSARQTAIQNQIKLAKAQGASLEEINALEKKMLTEQLATTRKSAEIEKNNIKNKLEARKQALKEENIELANQITGEIKQSQQKWHELKNQASAYRTDIEAKDIEFARTQEEMRQKEAEKASQQQQKNNAQWQKNQEEANKRKIEEQRLYEDLVIANIKNQNEREIAELALKHKREIEDVKAKYGEKSKVVAEMEAQQTAEMLALIDAQDEAFKKSEEEKDLKEKEAEQAKIEQDRLDKKSQLEADLLRLYEDFEAEQAVKMELAELERDWALENEKLTAGEREKIQAEYEKKVRDLKTETAEHDKKLKQEEFDRATDVISKSLQSAQNLTDVYFSIKKSKVEKGSREELAVAKKQFQVQKAMQLAMATIDGFKAVTASLAQSPIAIGVVPNPVGIASLAFAVTSSLANIAKIAATKFEGGGGSGGLTSVTPPSTTAPTETTVTPQAQGTQTGNLQGANQTQVVLVDSDLKAMANKVEVKDSLAKFP